MRITSISWPPSYEIKHKPEPDGNRTDFSFETKYQIINNGSRIQTASGNYPYIIPKMNTSLENSSLSPILGYGFYPVVVDVFFEEGITNVTSEIIFSIFNYTNQALPLGNYTFWYDVLNSLKETIQLIPFYTTINITENQVIIKHQGTNVTIIYLEQTNEISVSLISSLLVFVILILRKRRK